MPISDINEVPFSTPETFDPDKPLPNFAVDLYQCLLCGKHFEDRDVLKYDADSFACVECFEKEGGEK